MKRCRWCKGTLKKMYAFGRMPLVNYFPTQEEFSAEKRYSLTLCQCLSCGLVQLAETISPEKIFRNYQYVTGASQPLVSELVRFARLHPAKHVLDIGSNDGTLLAAYKKQGARVLGVEPSGLPSSVPTLCDFFSFKLAKKIKKTHDTFDLVCAFHVLANIPDLHDFLRGVQELLAEKGTFIIEVGSCETMIRYGQFDSIYHEHYSYFSKQSLSLILAAAGFRIITIEKIPTQGGSWRVYAVKGKTKKYKVVPEMFSMQLQTFRKDMRRLIHHDLKGKTVVGFGAPAKGVTLLNFCGFTTKDIAYVVDSTVQKQGRFVPGVHIPVYGEEMIKKSHVDAVLLLAWNYKPEILKKIKKHTLVITPFPKLVYTMVP